MCTFGGHLSMRYWDAFDGEPHVTTARHARARIGLQGPSPKADLIGPLKPDLGARDLLIQLRLQRALQHHPMITVR